MFIWNLFLIIFVITLAYIYFNISDMSNKSKKDKLKTQQTGAIVVSPSI